VRPLLEQVVRAGQLGSDCDDARPDPDAVRAFCQRRIAHSNVPRYVHITDDFPMTITVKVQKCTMREAAIDVLGLHDADAIRTA
jgi:acyl-CoA synthetase (AMP-forming)/AMP-acid ligase II